MSGKKKSLKANKRARIHYEKGLQHNELGNWGLADEEFYKALVCFQQAALWSDVVNCHCSIGNVSHNKGNIRETVKHWTQAAEICEGELRDAPRAAELYMDIGDLQYENHEIYASGDSYERAMKLFESYPTGNQLNTARIQQRLGNVCFSLDRADAAEKHFIRALTEYDALGREDEVAVVTKAIGHIYMMRNDYETAKQNFMACFSVFAKMGREDIKREVAGLLTEIDNREKSIELQQRLKAIEGTAVSSSSDGEGSQYAAQLGFNPTTIPALMSHADQHYQLADSHGENDPRMLNHNPTHSHLSDFNPNSLATASKANYSPADSKTKRRLADSVQKLTQRQQMQMRVDEQRYTTSPLQAAQRKSNVPRQKY